MFFRRAASLGLRYSKPRVYKFLPPIRPPVHPPVKIFLRPFSSLFEPDPTSNGVVDGYYLIKSVCSGDVSVIEHILDSGVDPNFRAEDVRGFATPTPLRCSTDLWLLSLPFRMKHLS
jgi:hypothetical protein